MFILGGCSFFPSGAGPPEEVAVWKIAVLTCVSSLRHKHGEAGAGGSGLECDRRAGLRVGCRQLDSEVCMALVNVSQSCERQELRSPSLPCQAPAGPCRGLRVHGSGCSCAILGDAVILLTLSLHTSGAGGRAEGWS